MSIHLVSLLTVIYSGMIPMNKGIFKTKISIAYERLLKIEENYNKEQGKIINEK